MNKDARAMRDHYGVPYSTALRLLRELGREGAIEKFEAQQAKPPEVSRCVHGTNPPSMCEHCSRAMRAP